MALANAETKIKLPWRTGLQQVEKVATLMIPYKHDVQRQQLITASSGSQMSFADGFFLLHGGN